MNDTDLYQLAALDAAGALDADARRDYERRLVHATPEVRAAIAEMYDGAAALVASLPGGDTPAPRVRARVMSATVLPGAFVSVRASEGEWVPLGMPGITARTLHVDTERHAAMLHVRVAAGVVYPGHHHSGPETSYVLSGEVIIQGQRLRAGDFHHANAGSDHDAIICEQDCELLLIIDAGDYVGL
jgi:anti-sigma factor ChrR (cupin superfamily)